MPNVQDEGGEEATEPEEQPHAMQRSSHTTTTTEKQGIDIRIGLHIFNSLKRAIIHIRPCYVTIFNLILDHDRGEDLPQT